MPRKTDNNVNELEISIKNNKLIKQKIIYISI